MNNDMPYKNKSLSCKERAEDLYKRMTLEEKLLQLAGLFPNGVKRLGIPHIQPGECLHGVLADEATSFPQAIALGSTWDEELIERIATVIAKEARALGIHHCYSPMLGVVRDTRWGRTEESYGEDPYLVARIGCAFIKGLQGMGDERFSPDKIFATAKHLVADAEPMSGINGAAVEISERSLHEVHLPPFRTAVEEAGVYSVMPAHHSLNGVPCHQNKYILDDIVRKMYGFDGFVVSDNGDIKKLHAVMKTVGSQNEGAVRALEAGVDVELAWLCKWGENRAYGSLLLDALEKGEISEDLIRPSVMRVLISKFLLGLFDDEDASGMDDSDAEFLTSYSGTEHIHYADSMVSFGIKKKNYKQVLYDDNSNGLAKEAAKKAMILLKNQGGLLPLDRAKIKKIAVLGPNSDVKLLGGYSTPAPRYFVTILDGIRNSAGDHIEILHARGCDPDDFSAEDISEAVALAKEADVVICALGGNHNTCRENQDIDTLDLTGDQQMMLERIHEVNKDIVLLLLNGRPNSIVWAKENIPAIIQCWYLGQETGNAVAAAIFGDTVPGGKLTVSIPRDAGQCPVFYNKLPSGREPSYYMSDPKPLFPFGFGLSYTRFELSDAVLSSNIMSRGGSISVGLTVENKGKYTGDEVVQLYLHDEVCSLVRPIKELKRFKRVTLEPGEKKLVEFELKDRDLEFWKDGKWVSEPGTICVMTGNDSENLSRAYFEYTG